jgi:hypothetical protein
MSSSYRRRCKYCDRWISMRQMPAGQWVAFEGDGAHDCAKPRAGAQHSKITQTTLNTELVQQEEGFAEIQIPSTPTHNIVPTPTTIRVSSSAESSPNLVRQPVIRALPSPPTRPLKYTAARGWGRAEGSAVGVLRVIPFLYVAVGALHSVAFDFIISPTACLTGKGLVWAYCYTGLGVSHLLITLGWPLYWFQ